MAGFDPNQLRNQDGQWARIGGKARATTFSEVGKRQAKRIKAIPRLTAYHTLNTIDQLHRTYHAGLSVGIPQLATGVPVVDTALNHPKSLRRVKRAVKTLGKF